MSSGVFDVLAYAKTLDGYKKHKPVITLGANVFEEYYDYFIKDGLIFIVGTTTVEDLDVTAIYTVSIINPATVNAIHLYKDINPNIDNMASTNTKSNFETVAKKICEGLANGSHNFGICSSCGVFNCQDVVGRVNDTFKTSGNLFSVETIVQDAVMFDKMANKDGTIMSNKILFGEFDKIETLYIPLHVLFYTPFVDYVPDEIKEMCKTYTKSMHIYNGVPYSKNKSYHKGERIKARVDNKGTIEYRYYVSKINGNTESPLDSENWIEITDKIVED